jgi:hypothetical protein
MNTKICWRCKEEKEITQFISKRRKVKTCKDCMISRKEIKTNVYQCDCGTHITYTTNINRHKTTYKHRNYITSLPYNSPEIILKF